MKELSIEQIEQKARAYDEALERARKLKNDPQSVFHEYSPKEGDTICDYIFPELKERKDEKTRKELISFIRRQIECHDKPNVERDEKFESWIDWLEKQGESIKIEKGKNYLCTKTHKYAGLVWTEGIKYYSPEDYSLVNEGCTCYCPKYSKEEHNNFFKEVECDDCLEADRIEPKFKEGDWTVSKLDGKARQILEVHYDEYNNYYVVENDARSIEEYDRLHHFWSIEDAKSGDVLTDGNMFVIFKSNNYHPNTQHGCMVVYCSIMKNNGDWHEFWHESGGYNPTYYLPATKEQHDLLFQKMKEAGYKWSVDKKELRKIEQKSADEVNPKFKIGDWIICCNYEPVQIISIRTNAYEMSNGDIRPFWMVDNNDNIRLWTVEDTKVGDVLVDEDNNIGIYKEIEGLYWNSYIYLGCDGKLRGFSIGGSHKQANTRPATKGQCDALMKAMTNAGYVFDFEKKELKKIEDKNPMLSYEREKTDVQKSAGWSAADEDAIGMAIIALDDMYDPDMPNTTYAGYSMPFNKAAERLKSLKSQKYVGYNPYKATVESIAEMCDKYENLMWDEIEAKDFLREVSAKCREAAEYDKKYPQWKPTEEQINIIDMILTDEAMDDNVKSILKELKEQLKQL